MVELRIDRDKKIRGNIECGICTSTFEFEDDRNGDAIVKSIDVENGVDKAVNFKIMAKCNICGFKSEYSGKLKK